MKNCKIRPLRLNQTEILACEFPVRYYGGNRENEVEFYPNAEFSILECWENIFAKVSHSTLSM